MGHPDVTAWPMVSVRPAQAPLESGPRWPRPMTDEPSTEAEVDAIVVELLEAGLLTIGPDAEGKETWALTDEGARVARMLAVKGDGASPVLERVQH